MSTRKRRFPRPEFRRVYWDSCIFIAWLTGESRKQVELDGLREAVEQAAAGELVVVVSRMFEQEVFTDDLPVDVRRLLERFFRQPTIEVVDLEPPIHSLARQIRGYYRQQKQQGLGRFCRLFQMLSTWPRRSTAEWRPSIPSTRAGRTKATYSL
ncbi:MAG TPA: hypothetical protein PK413_12860 [Thermoanaerobaculia bacterium]|nr:hypothetical protein [Thermoanaerobaculia bacterium]